MAKRQSWHVNIGNSNSGTIGLCARVHASSKKEALKIIRKLLPEEIDITRQFSHWGDLEYCCVYFNPARITLADIGDPEPIEKE